MPLVSFVIPVYNASRYLRESIESVLAQTLADIEVVLVDDGSTDGSGDICDQYAAKDRRVRSLHFPNSGVAVTRNRGVAAARGRYIAFVDADDMVHPQFAREMLALIEATGAAMAMCGDTSASPSVLSTEGSVHTTGVDDAIEGTLYQTRYLCSLWAKLWPREALVQEPMREGIFFEDLDSFYRLYQAIDGNIAVMSAPMYFYRCNAASFMHNFSPARLDVLEVTDRIERHFAGHPRLAAAARDRKFSANYNIFLLASRHGLDDVASRCWQVVRAYRASEITNRRVRLKNRIGAVVSYLGRPVARMLSHLF